MHIIDKQIGETPYMALEWLRKLESIPADVPLAYAGRLDPMASGKLLVLVGEECKDQKRYQGIDKDYEVEVLLGVSSDTGDILGIVESALDKKITKKAVTEAAQTFVGPYAAPYPAYSSRTVNGKPLFQWALIGRLAEIEIPLQHGTIHKIKVENVREMDKAELQTEIMEKLKLVPLTDDPRKILGKNFRIDAVRASWEHFFKVTEITNFTIAKISVATSSGVYMRTLAGDLANTVGTAGLALSIHRTKLHVPGPVAPAGGASND